MQFMLNYRFFVLSLTSVIGSTAFAASTQTEAQPQAVKPEQTARAAVPKNRELLDRVEASVNSSVVLQSDIKKFRQTLDLRAQLDPLFSNSPLAKKGPNVSDKEIVSFLIDEKLISQQFPISDSEVDQEISQIQTNNRVDREGLRNALREKGFQFEDYFELIRIGISKRNMFEREIRPKVSIQNLDIDNAIKGKSPLSYHIGMILLSAAPGKSQLDLKKEAQEAYKSLKSGTPFKEVANTYMGGDSSADLGFLTEDQMSDAIRETVLRLSTGQISEVFPAGQGNFAIVKLFEKKQGEGEHLRKLREEAQSKLAVEEYQKQWQLYLDRKRQTAYIHITGSEPAKEAAAQK